MTTTTETLGMNQAAKLRQLEREESARDQSARRRMFIDFADGKQIEFASMRKLGLTTDSLEHAKERILHNRELKEKVDKIAAAEVALTTLKADIKDMLRVRDEVIEEHNSAIRAVEAELDRAHKVIAEGKAARAELIRECRNSEALAAVDAVDSKMNDVRQELAANQATRTAKWDALASCKSRLATGSVDADVSARAIRLTEEVQLLDDRRIALNAEFERLKIERETVETESLCDPDLL